MSLEPQDNEKRMLWLRTMLTIRVFEEKVEELYKQGILHGGSHSSAGEEAIAVGACAALASEDLIVTNYRCNGHCIAKGLELHRIMAEVFGKASGCCKGKGGAMHISDIERGILPTSAIVGGGIPIATGSGLSAKLYGTGRVTLCFFGDGASNQGVFHESLNLAAIWKLPVVYVCENNQYAMSMPVRAAMAIENIAERACAYGIEGKVVDGNDVDAVYEAISAAVERARGGEGPSLIECKTYRLRGHYIGDPLKYRSKEELAEQQKKEPISLFRARLLAENLITDVNYQRMEKEAVTEIEDAVRFARDSVPPVETELTTQVYD
jgi:TPP-dependent pyruvate/acetoin dehydrogenase alpha subunit